MGKKEDDGIVVWKENDISFLPEDISKDKLTTFIKLLIGRVKEDHAIHTYKKDLRDYRREIIQIVNVAQQGGYKLQDYELPSGPEVSPQNMEVDDSEWDGVVDD